MIVRITLLDSIVGKMYFWLEGVDVELVGGSSDVSLLVPIGPGDSEEVGDHHVVADIEFAVVVEQRPINIHLHYVRPLLLLLTLSTSISLFQQ